MATAAVDSITATTFAGRVLQADRPVLIQFWAEWCGPCRKVSPVVEQLAAEHAAALDVVKVNVDEEPELAAEHGVASIPAFTVYAGGERRETWVGAAPKPAMERTLAAYLR